MDFYPCDYSFLNNVMFTDIASFSFKHYDTKRGFKSLGMCGHHDSTQEHECEKYCFDESHGTSSQRVLRVTIRAYL